MIKMNTFFRNRKRIVIITGILCISIFSAGLLTNAVTNKPQKMKVGANTMTLFAWPEKYALTMSSTPGIRMSAKYNGSADKVRYSTKNGSFETWNIATGKITNCGQKIELPLDEPIYWSPMEKGKETKSRKTYVNVSILNKNTIIAEKRMGIISDGGISYKVDTASDVVIETSKSEMSMVANPEKTIQDLKSMGKAHNSEQKDELPKIIITIGNKQISYATAKHKWNGNIYTAEDTFKTLLKNVSGTQIPYIKLGETAAISFKNNPPSKLEVSDMLLNNDGGQCFNDSATAKTVIEPYHNGKFYYFIGEIMASSLRNVILKTEIRGIRMIALWGKNKCEYAFVIRTDAAGAKKIFSN